MFSAKACPLGLERVYRALYDLQAQRSRPRALGCNAGRGHKTSRDHTVQGAVGSRASQAHMKYSWFCREIFIRCNVLRLWRACCIFFLLRQKTAETASSQERIVFAAKARWRSDCVPSGRLCFSVVVFLWTKTPSPGYTFGLHGQRPGFGERIRERQKRPASALIRFCREFDGRRFCRVAPAGRHTPAETFRANHFAVVQERYCFRRPKGRNPLRNPPITTTEY